MKQILLVSVFVICLWLFGCQDSTKNHPVTLVERKTILPVGNPAQKPNPLMLVVEITKEGKLSLNKIETGTIADQTLLSEKLKVIFDDREKTSIKEKKVVIDPQGKVRDEDLEKLVETLASVKASPIQIIKNNL